MAHCPRAAGPTPARRLTLDIADVFRAHGAAFGQRHTLSPEQRATVRAITTCRTAARGGHLDVCDHCGYARPAYNSCRNRHCPKCQALREARWIEARMAHLVPAPYFHVVFTLPAALRPLVLRNRRRVFTLLFRAASQTLLTLGRDPARLGAHLGVTAVLHTWTRDLRFHPHLHCIVTGGGLAPDARRWIAAPRRHLFPVRVLGQLFRGKFLAALTRTYTAGHLVGLPRDDRRVFARWRAELYRHDWVVYAKRPFAGPQQLFRYLGRYTQRVGLSNHRLRAITPTAVRFATKHGREVTLAPEEFVRRFLLHVLPRGFVKIRHYGLFAPGPHSTCARAAARRLLRARPATPAPPREDWRTLLTRLTGLDLTRCPHCATGTMIATPLRPECPRRAGRPPPPPRDADLVLA